MPVLAQNFFSHVSAFIDYRKVIYEASPQTLKSNQCDLRLFEHFMRKKNHETISGPAVIDFQYYLKQTRDNCGGSINRKLFTLRAYSNFLKLQDDTLAPLPFYDVLKSRGGYRNRPNALTCNQIKHLFDTIDRNTFLGIRDYAAYALMYQAGLRVGEVFLLNLLSIDFDEKIITVIGKGKKKRVLHLTNEMARVLSEWIAARPHFYSTQPYIHPSAKRIREAMEKLPGVIYMNKLIESGQVKFQSPFYPKKE